MLFRSNFFWVDSKVQSNKDYISCGANEELFTEIANMDSDKYANQWFRCDDRIAKSPSDIADFELWTKVTFATTYKRATAKEIKYYFTREFMEAAVTHCNILRVENEVPIGCLYHKPTQTMIHVHTKIGWFRKLMIWWLIGLKYQHNKN